MTELGHIANWSKVSSVGGQWNWDNGFNGVTAGLSATSVTASDLQMLIIDRRIDDGDLTSGVFQKINGRFTFILAE